MRRVKLSPSTDWVFALAGELWWEMERRQQRLLFLWRTMLSMFPLWLLLASVADAGLK